MGSNGVQVRSGHSSLLTSPEPRESDNNFNNLMFGELQQMSPSSVGFSHPAEGWAKPAVAAHQQPTCAAGMWSPQNPNGTPLQGWDCDKGNLFAFAHFNAMCESCQQVVRCSMNSKQPSCTSPAFLAASDRGRFGGNAEGLICYNRPARERCYALEVLATLVQDENWTLRSVSRMQAEYLDCLRFYLNQQFLKLVEQGKVLQCFDETGRAVWICFCTGLQSFRGEFLFCILQREYGNSIEISSSWHYSCFVTSRELKETTQPWNAVEPILTPPEKAIFFDNYLDLVYLPSEGENIQLDPQIWDGLEDQLPFLPKSLFNSTVTLEAKKHVVISALHTAMRKYKNNPFMAVPQFHGLCSTKSGVLQLLLPMQLDPDADTTHLALALEISKTRRGGHMYRGTEMIPLTEAYANARVVMPVREPWLSSLAFTYELTCTLKGYFENRQPISAKGHYRPNLGCEPNPHSSLSAPASFNSNESFSRTYSGPSENWLCMSQPSTNPQRWESLSFQTTSDSSSLICPLASGLYRISPSKDGEGSTSHHQVSSPPNDSPTGNVGRTYVDTDGDTKSMDGTGVTLPLDAETLLKGSTSTSSSRFPSCNEITRTRSFDNTSFLQDKEQLNAPQSPHLTSLFQGGKSSNQTSGYPTSGPFHAVISSFGFYSAADLGGHTWGVSSVSPSLCTSVSSDSNGGSMRTLNDVPVGFIPPSTMRPDYISQSRQGATSSTNFDMSRLGPVGLFQAHTGLGLSAICGDFDGHRQDGYLEFTPADDACPKVNIWQLPPRFVTEFLSGRLPGCELNAELYTSQALGRLGMVARSFVLENKNHGGKWFAIVEFAYWIDEAARLQLIRGGDVLFLDFYGGENVVCRRHKDKHKDQCMLPQRASCRPFWEYTGADTKSGRPLYKGLCSQCGKESTVPFRPIVTGEPPLCRTCRSLQQTISVAMPSELMVRQHS